MILEVTIVLTIGIVVAALPRARAAATRHFVWVMTLGGALLVGALSFVPKKTIVIPWGLKEVNAPERLGRTSRIIRSARSLSPLRATEGADPSVRRDAIPVIPILWGTGSTAIFAWWLIGYAGLTRIARAAAPVPDEVVNGRGVRVRLSSAVGAPVTWGWLRPIVLFPADSIGWPAERKRAALMHELAHVARRDALAQFVGTLACAIYWFHPLVWIAAKQLRRESEHASDDLVLTGGMTSSEYAAHLLAVARERFRGSLFALGMGSSHLETRVQAVLDEERARGAGSRRARLIAAALVVFVLIPFAACRTELRAATRVLKLNEPRTTIERTVNASPSETLRLELETGASVAIRGWNEPRVNVRAHVGGPDLANARIDAVRSDNGVQLSAKYERGRNEHSSSIKLEVNVPKQFNVSLDSTGGNVSIADVSGEFDGHTNGGPFVLERLKGRASLSTDGGDITVTDSVLAGSVTTGGGTVTLTRVSGGLKADSGSGPVIQSDKATGWLRIEKGGGGIKLDEAPNGAFLSTGGGRIDLGRGVGRVEAHTGGGDIKIGPVAGSVITSTGAGDIHVIVADAGGEPQTVDATTGFGDVIAEIPKGIDARVELEFAFTETPSDRDIEALMTTFPDSWHLRFDPLTDWNKSSYVPPRRFLRAHGVSGKGRGLVRIRVVNGSIVLRHR